MPIATKNKKAPIKRNKTTNKRESGTVFSRAFQTFNKLSSRTRSSIFILIFAAIGTYTLLPGNAETQVVAANKEAESLVLPITKGQIRSDATASASKSLMIWSNGEATGNLSLATAATRLVVTAKADNCKGSPTMVVKIGGKQVQTATVTSTAWASYPVAVNVPAGSHSLSVAFVNDYNVAGTCDRNLIVDAVNLYTVVPAAETLTATQEAESAALPGSQGQIQNDSSASAGKLLMIWSNGAASSSVDLQSATSKLVVRAKGHNCNGMPQMQVKVGGVQVYSGTVTTTAWADYSMNVNLAKGSHTVTVGFTNDYTVSGTCDRNLLVDKVSYYGVAPTATSTTTPSPTPTTTADTTLPVISVTAPVNGATVSGAVTVTANATDNVGISKIEFLVDGIVKSSGTNQSYTLASTEIPNGAHTITARAYDAANNTSTSASVSVNVSNVPPAPIITTTAPLFTETFTGPDGVFVSERDFYGSTDLGFSKNQAWIGASGTMNRVGNAGKTTYDNWAFRMYTRQLNYQYVKAEVDIKFDGFYGGTDGWHGINFWLNEQMCTPWPSCSSVNDPNSGGGNSGYAVDFMNRDGGLTILKKVSGDTRGKWIGAMDYVQGGTYYELARSTFKPVVGQTYRVAAVNIDNGNGVSTLQIIIDGQVKLQVRDDGNVAGPRLGPGRVGLRSDHANMTVDNFIISNAK